MKRVMLFVLFSFLIVSCGCRKKYNPQPAQPSLPPGDARSVLLKDLNAHHMPSPYFHFAYDAEHYVTRISYASGFSIYDVHYSKNRVKEMINVKNGNVLLYTYAGPHVGEISEISAATGRLKFIYRFTYDENGLLTETRWYEHSGEAAVLFKKAALLYHPDGNLASINRYMDSSGHMNWVSRETFSDYDDKINVDDFYLLKTDFFESLLFLPQVRLQRNNPRKRAIFGLENDYELSYTYQYLHNLPVSKTANMLQTRGADKGRSFQITDRFNYY